MPLHAKHEAVPGVLDSLDHPVGRARVHDQAGGGLAHGLMVGAVDLDLVHSDDPVQQGFGRDRDGMAGLGARVGLLVGERARDRVGDVLNERAAERDVQELLAPADAEHGHLLSDRAVGQGELEGGPIVLGRDRLVARLGAEMGGVDVEVAARDDEPVDQREIGLDLLRLVGQQHRRAAGRRHDLAVILAQRVPGKRRIAARRFGIEGEPDDRPLLARHGRTVGPPDWERNARLTGKRPSPIFGR